MDKYKNKYRISSTRLQSWNYGWSGAYFVTICTQNREHYLGEFIKGELHLSEIGEIAHKFWLEIPHHFPFVKLAEFVVMPNHVHGIVIIDKPVDGHGKTVETPKLGVSTPTPITTVPANDSNSTRTAAATQKWKPGTLGVIINQYKRICTINARKIHANFAWQPGFYDHIIRNDKSFNKTQEYIIHNPLNWMNDKLYKEKSNG